jgi:aminoglycoside/choline kinase family phosphotransferase
MRWTGTASGSPTPRADNPSMAPFAFDHVSPVLREFLARHGVERGDVSLAGIAGSRRAYYRIQAAPQTPGAIASCIVLVSPDDDLDFGRFLRITQFYRMLRFPVPRVYCIDDAARQVLLEDLGHTRLYDALRLDRETGLNGYKKTLEILADLQTRCGPFHRECPDIHSRVFDETQLLWETGYYRENYLEGHRGLRPDPRLTALFETLAARVDGHPKTIMHRDFQSQNLMLKPDGCVHVIDYQGSRLGSYGYDLASLLLDPYVMLSDDEIDGLLRYFHSLLENPPPFEVLEAAFLEAGMQRVMQALGAYCFLSRVKGIPEFAGHIPAGEARLRWLIQRTGGEWAAVLPG